VVILATCYQQLIILNGGLNCIVKASQNVGGDFSFKTVKDQACCGVCFRTVEDSHFILFFVSKLILDVFGEVKEILDHFLYIQMGNNQISRPETAVLITVELFPHLAFIFRWNINHQLNFSGQGYRRLFHIKGVFENVNYKKR